MVRAITVPGATSTLPSARAAASSEPSSGPTAPSPACTKHSAEKIADENICLRWERTGEADRCGLRLGLRRLCGRRGFGLRRRDLR